MKIDKVMYPTLERTPIRDAICYGALAGQDVPSNRIQRFDGWDKLAFDTETDFYEAAIADGFAEPFTSYLNGEIKTAQNYITVTWTYLSVLRQIAASDGITMVLLDDVRLKKNFVDYEILLESCPDFNILQIWWWWWKVCLLYTSPSQRDS